MALPERLDEDLALRVGAEGEEGVLLARLQDRLDVEQELAVDLGKVLDALLALGARERLRLRQRARREQQRGEERYG